MRKISGELYSLTIPAGTVHRLRLENVVALSVIENAGVAVRYHPDYGEGNRFDTVPSILFPPIANSVYDVDIGISQAAPSLVSVLVIRDLGPLGEPEEAKMSQPAPKAKNAGAGKAKVKKRAKPKPKPVTWAKAKAKASPNGKTVEKPKAKPKAKPRALTAAQRKKKNAQARARRKAAKKTTK